MDLAIHDITKIEVRAVSLPYADKKIGDRFHIQKIEITDKQGKHHQITLFFQNVSDVLPVGDSSGLDQASSNEDYMGLLEAPIF